MWFLYLFDKKGVCYHEREAVDNGEKQNQFIT